MFNTHERNEPYIWLEIKVIDSNIFWSSPIFNSKVLKMYYNGIFSMYLLKLFSGSGNTNVYNYFYLLEQKINELGQFFFILTNIKGNKMLCFVQILINITTFPPLEKFVL